MSPPSGDKNHTMGSPLLTREPADEIIRGFEDGKPDEEARLIAGSVNGVWVVNTYVPQGRALDDPAFQAKLDFFARLKDWLENRFHAGERLIWTGDLNVAPEDIDVYDPERLAGQVSCHPAERQALAAVVSWA